MALRGHQSLQELVGRTSIKKGGFRKEGPKAAETGASQAGTSSNATDASAQKLGERERGSLEGIRCPLCNMRLAEAYDAYANALSYINTHIDACLSKSAVKKEKQQTTLLQFATRRVPEQAAATSSGPGLPSPSSGDGSGGGGCSQQDKEHTAAAAAGAAMAAGAGAVAMPLQAAARASVTATVAGQAGAAAGAAAVSGPWLAPPPCLAGDTQPKGTPSCSWGSPSTSPPASPRSAGHDAKPMLQASPLTGSGGRGALPTSPTTLTISYCLLVGRRFQRADTRLCAGQRVVVEWEEGNARDPNALLVKHLPSGQACGYLPSLVSRHLAPLVRGSAGAGASAAVVEGVLLEDAPNDRAPLPVELQVTLTSSQQCSPGGKARSPGGGSPAKDLTAAVQLAQQAAAEHAQRLGSGGLSTGARLRANFLTVLGTVVQHDGHLLDEAERAFAQAFQGLQPAAASLLLRLFQRRGPWFLVASLSYEEVPDVPAALGLLCDQGMAHLLHADGSWAGSGGGAAGCAARQAGLERPAPPSAGSGSSSGSESSSEGSSIGSAASDNLSGGSDDSWSDEEEQVSQKVDTCISSMACGTAGPVPGPPGTTSRAAASAPGSLRPGPEQAQRQRGNDTAPVPAPEPPSISWGEVAELLTVPELVEVLARASWGGGRAPIRLGAGATRAQVLEALEAAAGTDEPGVRGALLGATGDVVRLSAACCEAINRFQRLFFLNEGHSLSQFLAVDLGGVRYPRYAVHRSQSAFADRAALLQYERALRHAEALTDAVEAGDVAAAKEVLQHAWAALDAGAHRQLSGRGQELPLFLKRFHAGWVYCMMATVGVSLLEREKDYGAAVGKLQQLLEGECCPGRRGFWWLRRSVDLGHLGRVEESLSVAEAALDDEWLAPGDRLALQRRVLRLGKPPRRWRTPAWEGEARWEPRERRIEGRPLNSVVGAKSRFYGPDGQLCSVEQLALQFYASEEGGGWSGVHSEGGVWAMLFGLLLWDVLFCPVPDVLRTPFQTAPLDLDTDAFFPARRGEVEAVLARVSAGEAPAMLASRWQAVHGTLCRGVSWDRWQLWELQAVARCVGGCGLAAVCRLLVEDHAGWSGGMPDLLLWHPGRGEALLSEVKGPRDSLSDQQRAWMRALEGAGVPVEVLKVVEPEVPGGAGAGGAGKKRRRRG